MNINNIFTGPNPFASGLPTIQSQSAKDGQVTIFQKMEKVAADFQGSKDHGLIELSKEDLLHLDQEIFSTKLEQSRIDMLNQQGITEELLDGIGNSLKKMGSSVSGYLDQLDEFQSKLAVYDSSIAAIQSKLSGTTPFEDGETADSLTEGLAALETERQDYITGRIGGLISAATESESIVHQTMDGLRNDEDIWALLSSSNSKDVQKALDYLSQKSLGMTMDPGGDLYSQMDSSRKAVMDTLSAFNNIGGLVNKYREKLGLKTDSTLEFSAPANRQDVLNQFYLQNSMWMQEDGQKTASSDTHFHRLG